MGARTHPPTQPTNYSLAHITHQLFCAGKVSITIASECTHDRMTALLGSTMSEGSSLRDKLQVR
jgi:hypothetical protein